MYLNIKSYCTDRTAEYDQIPSERKALLERIAVFLSKKLAKGEIANLVYICTHNSRRSHFGQIWGKVASAYFNIAGVKTFSGGTEATAFNNNAINALVRVGFKIKPVNSDKNAIYHVFYDEGSAPIVCFSKTFDHPENPQGDFAAIMTCGEAEENCPFIPGVDFRIATTYEDPKAFDGTPGQDNVYDERCRQIAREVLYVFSKVTTK
jgi:arsenate reductase (thioredoxin)